MANVVSLGDRLTLSVNLVDELNLLGRLDDSVGKVRNRAVVLGFDVEKLRSLAGALCEGRVLQVNVSGKEVLVTSEAPHVEVINGSDSRQGENITADHVSPDLLGSALHEHVDALHESRDGGEHDENGEEEGAERVDNLPVGLVYDDNSSDDDTN